MEYVYCLAQSSQKQGRRVRLSSFFFLFDTH